MWAESCDALVLPGQGPSKPQQERLRLDADLVRGALQDEDVRAAMRIVDGKVDLAPEAKATKVLPGLFPAGASPICADFAARFAQVLPEDIEKFLKLLKNEFQHAQLRRGAGPGGSIAEFWTFTAKAPEEVWGPIGQALLQLALGNVPPDALKAIISSRLVALDRPEADKVRPLAVGNFLRKCANRAKAKLFKGRVARKVRDLAYCLGAGRPRNSCTRLF